MQTELRTTTTVYYDKCECMYLYIAGGLLPLHAKTAKSVQIKCRMERMYVLVKDLRKLDNSGGIYKIFFLVTESRATVA